jgi:GAF domain-containing protein
MTRTMATETELQRTVDALRRELAARTAELAEVRAEQAASAEVLKIVSASRGELAPVFQAILENSVRICEATFGHMVLVEGDLCRVAAEADMPKELAEFFSRGAFEPTPGSHLDRVMRTSRVSHTPDDTAEPVQGISSRYGGARSIIAVPMLQKDTLVGVILIYRQEVRPFTDRQIALLENFASQAVIAIENARLFDETREALERQTATSEILEVINRSPGDLTPVFEAILRNAHALCGVEHGSLQIIEGGNIRAVALHGIAESLADRLRRPRAAAEAPMLQGLLQGQRYSQVSDVRESDSPILRSTAELQGARTLLSVPLRREGDLLGMIICARREVKPFTEREISLLENFAAQAAIAIENARLLNEVQAKTHDIAEALRYQTGSANILNVIASSPTDVQPVLKAIVESACELCEAHDAVVLLKDGTDLCFSAHHGPIPINTERWPIDRSWASGRAVIDQATVHVHDIYAEDAGDFTAGRELSQRAGSTAVRSILAAPLLREGESIGAILLRRQEVRPFNDKQIAMLQTFADQAVIAIGNVRLFDEVQAKTHDLEEALRYQTGSANILRVIASSPTDVKPVLQAIVESACELCGAYDALVRLKDGEGLAFGAHRGPLPVSLETIPFSANSTAGFAMIEQKPVHVQDLHSREGDRFPQSQELARAHGERTILSVPLLRESESVGAIVLRRSEVNPFTDKQIALLQTFADQAVIAIGNVRLFDEVQTKTHDLEEALRYQTGSANILNVIASSPTDVQPVLKAIVESACELCGAYDAVALLREGDHLRFGAHHGPIPVETHSLPISRSWTPGLVVIEQKPVHIHDLLSSEGDQVPDAQRRAREFGYRTILSVPLLREGESVGSLSIRRREVSPFSDKQIALLQTFADQAAIAIENVRLFDEVQARTRDLQESLQQQTATADVLKVISRSAFDLQTVLDTLTESAAQLANADMGSIARKDERGYYHATNYKFAVDWVKVVDPYRLQPGRDSVVGRALVAKKAVQIADVLADAEYNYPDMQKAAGYRTLLGVPLMRQGDPIGVLFLGRKAVEPFTDKQVELVSTFADQAVIAIENVRLFEEVQARTRELAQSLDDLRAAQDRLVQTEKLASLGQLTAGIAHEIKNPLNFVNNFSALSVELTDELNAALKQATLADKLRAEVDELTGLLKDNLAKVVQHGKRADSIVKNMLLHSREGSGEHRPADINALVDESLNLAYHGARAEKPQFNVTLQRNFDPEAGMVDVFPQEITRVFLNLLSNGFYAVTKRKADDGAGFEPTVSAMTKGRTDGVEIRIRDNGTGIPPAVKEKMFNPFFTTKSAGEGTGLGLSMSYDIIVKQHGGTIDVETVPEEFTEFRIVLPRTSLSKKN